MAGKDEFMELGRLILQSEMDVIYIKNLRIEEQVNEHGRMTVRFLSETYAYDAENCLCRKRDRNGAEILYTYNMYGNPLERRAKAAGAEASELSGRYEYTAKGLLKSAISRSGTGDGTIGMRYSYAHDSMGRLAEKSASGRTLLSLAYGLNGNLTRQTDVTGKVTEYRHDLVDRVREVWDNGKQAAGYEYNPDGTVRSLSCGGLYTEYGYDADRNLTSLRTTLGRRCLRTTVTAMTATEGAWRSGRSRV